MFPSHLILFFVTLFSIGNGSFDCYKLALQWPGTYCIDETSNCTEPVPDRFTVHGLWPSNRTGPDPSNCSDVPLPPLSIIQKWPFAADLNSYWPNLNGFNYNFWRHEWTVHGTCSTLCPKGYFNLTLSLYKTLGVPDLLPNLAKQSVVPRSEPGYPRAKLEAAFKAALGGRNDMLIKCNKINKSDYLSEVRVFINPKSLAVIPFNKTDEKKSNCSNIIIFPPVNTSIAAYTHTDEL